MTFNWTISDSSGATFNNSLLKIYKNSLGLSTALLKRNNHYTISAIVSDGISIGNISVTYDTDPDLSFEFFVEPQSGEALMTKFAL